MSYIKTMTNILNKALMYAYYDNITLNLHYVKFIVSIHTKTQIPL
jgi:hypothetical protein